MNWPQFNAQDILYMCFYVYINLANIFSYKKFRTLFD